MDTAADGKEALAMIQQKRYDLIFMDHLMPVMDGIEAAKRVRQLKAPYYQQVPIIALSANEQKGVKEQFLQAGMNDTAAKPIEMADIRAKLKKWLPAELIQEQSPGEAPSSDASPSGEQTLDVSHIEGLNTADGIRYSGSKEMFITLLGAFYKLIDLKTIKIEKSLDDGDIRTVTIEVHALKNTARMIGAASLSEGFGRLEQYGNDGNLEALERETPEILAQFKRYKPILKPFGEASEKDKKAVPKEELISLLRELKSSMDSFDLDGADEALRRLEMVQLPPECRPQMETLRAYVSDVEMEEVMDLAEAMIQTIEKLS
jgi:CheY-like chemotaxis protein/HPt (histidine-containing phosphotransfer) domain-containing protein